MAGSLLPLKEWVVQIIDMIHDDDNPQVDAHLIPPNEQSQADADPFLRVARHLLNSKPDAYIPQIFCFGPYHHSKSEKDIDSSCRGGNISTGEAYKGKYAAELSRFLRTYGKNFKSIVEIVEKNMEKIKRFYDGPIDSNTEDESSKNFALMMAVDSSFLLCFLISLFTRSNEDMINLYPCIKQDILKLENQIPLCILIQVFETVKSEAITFGARFNQLLNRTMYELSPFRDGKIEYYKVAATEHNIDKLPQLLSKMEKQLSSSGDGNIDFQLAKERHLLGCMHRFVSRFLDIRTCQNNPETPWQLTSKYANLFCENILAVCENILAVCPCIAKFEIPFLKGTSAQHLSRCGIKFESFFIPRGMTTFDLLCKPHDKIRFDKQSGTLYLPKISVSEVDTEVWLRNMLALEFNNVSTSDFKRPVTRYVALMSILMQSPSDVRLLMDKDVIDDDLNCHLSEEDILNMWNRVSRPFFTQSSNNIFPPEFGQDLMAVLERNYMKTKIKRVILGIYDFVSSFKFLGSVGAFLVIVMTAIQTYCAVVQLHASRGSN